MPSTFVVGLARVPFAYLLNTGILANPTTQEPPIRCQSRWHWASAVDIPLIAEQSCVVSIGRQRHWLIQIDDDIFRRIVQCCRIDIAGPQFASRTQLNVKVQREIIELGNDFQVALQVRILEASVLRKPRPE
jgi:hypothetical protein